MTAQRSCWCKELSRGQTQRVVLAKTLLHRPRVLILDEPASGLDPLARRDLRHALRKLAAGGATVFVSSHILSELASRGDSTPVIMVSAKGQTQLAVKALRAGAVDCIDKASPQFLELPALVKNVYARQQERLHLQRRPAHPTEKSAVLLIEQSEVLRQNLASFFGRHATQLVLAQAEVVCEEWAA